MSIPPSGLGDGQRTAPPLLSGQGADPRRPPPSPLRPPSNHTTGKFFPPGYHPLSVTPRYSLTTFPSILIPPSQYCPIFPPG